MRLRYKLFTYLLAMLLCIVFAQGFFYNHYHNKQKFFSASNKIVNIISVLANHMSYQIESEELVNDYNLISDVRKEFNINYLAIFNKKGEFLTDFDSKRQYDYSFMESASSEPRMLTRVQDISVELSMPFFKSNGSLAGFIYANYDKVFAVDNDTFYQDATRVIYFLFSLLAIVFTIMLSFYVLYPVVVINDFIKKYTDGKNYDTAVLKNLTADKDFTDISEFIYNMVDNVKHAESSRTEVLANISHELRTPMHAIMGYVELLEDEDDELTSEEKSKIIVSLHENGDRLLSLINNLLDLSKLGTNKFSYVFKTFDLKILINKVVSQVKPLYTKKRIAVNIKFDTDAKRLNIWGDEARLYQVIWNILGNAIQYSPTNSKIDIEVQQSTMKTSNDREIKSMEISITDEGGGIPDDELESIFSPFVQSSKTKTGAGGTGLGLSISREVVEGHNGKIRAENSDDGACFIVSLPVNARNRG